MSSFTAPYNYEGKDNALFAIIFVSVGIVASFSSGILLDRLKKFKLTMILLSANLILFNALTFYSLPAENKGLFCFNIAMIGLSSIPVLPICFSYSVELTYPISEEMSNGILLLPAQMYGALLGLLIGYLSKYSPMYGVGIFTANSIIALVASIFTKERLNRL